MRAIFLALSALVVVNAVSLKQYSAYKGPRREEIARSQISDKIRLFAQQETETVPRVPKGEITPELREQVWNAFGLSKIDTNGDRKITFKEALESVPKKFRRP
jgi:hypothetical protein